MHALLQLLWIGLAFGVASQAIAQPKAAPEKIVRVYNWSDYIDPKVLADFTRESGIQVVYDTYESNEALDAKLQTGTSGYDVVVPSAPFLQRQIKAGLFQKLDKTRLPHAAGLWPQVMSRLAIYDPGNLYAVNYMWFTTGIAFNARKIADRSLGQPMTAWDQVLRPEALKKFADCGVFMLDSPEDMLAIAQNTLKLGADSKNPADIRRAADLLARLRPMVKKFTSIDAINALANGDICLAVGWTGDAFQARNRAREADNGVEINYVIPREGTLMSMDNLAIPRDAPHPLEAHAFIDYLLRPEVAARNSSKTGFANSVPASRALLDKELADNKSVWPDDEMMKKLFNPTLADAETQKLVAREWLRVKTGK